MAENISRGHDFSLSKKRGINPRQKVRDEMSGNAELGRCYGYPVLVALLFALQSPLNFLKLSA